MQDCKYYPPTPENVSAANKDINSYRNGSSNHSGLLAVITDLDRALAFARSDELPLENQVVYEDLILRAQSIYDSVREQFEFSNPKTPTWGKRI